MSYPTMSIEIGTRVVLRRVGSYAKSKSSLVPGTAVVLDIFPGNHKIPAARIKRAYGPLTPKQLAVHTAHHHTRYVVRRTDNRTVAVIADYAVFKL